jgi:nucleoside triphosphate diphosphatase
MSPEQQIPGPDGAPAEHLERSLAGDSSLGRSLALVRYLRDHCEWDARQTPTSLRPYLLEEAHEVADAILASRDEDLGRELGDLLLNLAFQIVLAEERGAFGAPDVVSGLEDKMRERHPHVYGDAEGPPDWERLKAELRSRERQNAAADPPPDPFDGLPAGLDPLSRSLRMQDRAAGLNFDWPSVRGAFEKLEEELEELRESLGGRVTAAPVVERRENRLPETPERIEEELGDLLFAAVNVARLAGIHPTVALERSAAKFASRFRDLLALAALEGLDPRYTSLEELDVLWERVKATGISRP